MAEDINKKITIDVEVTTDGQQQIQQYKAAFDGLRNTVNDLSKPINDLSNNINTLTGSIDKLDKQNQTTSSSGNKLKDNIINLASTYNSLKSVIELVKAAFNGLEAEVTAGLSLLIAFGPEIIKWVSNLFKADVTTKSLNQTLREHKLVLQAVNKARLQGDQNAQQELVNLKLLYKASQDQVLSIKERKKAVTELQAEYLDYFGNISVEVILAGKATGAYNKLTQAILANSRARAAENMLAKNSERQLGDADKVNSLKAQLQDKEKEIEEASKEYRKNVKAIERGRGRIGTSTDEAGLEKINQLRQERDNMQKMFYDASNDSLILDKQNKALTDVITKNVEEHGVQTLTGLKKAVSNGKKNVAISSGNTSPVSGNQTPAASSDNQLKGQEDADTVPEDVIAANEAYLENKAKKEEEIAKQTTQKIIADAAQIKADNQKKEDEARKARDKKIKDEALQQAQQLSTQAFSIFQNNIKQQTDAKVAALEKDKNSELSNTSLTSAQKIAIQQKYKLQEDKVKAKAFKEEQDISIAQAIINGALAITKVTSQSGVLAPLEVGMVIAETAVQVAKIASQKPPAYARGGLHYTSDGKGGVLPGYSRIDNTNAYLRSGEGIVVSEAMRDPWARNLVSAINVGFGGRDFATTTTSRGFAVGGIFTDGGDANRYYNQPVNDQKNLANTIAYQMVNNFPPVYVDVKDINNQQNILAQTINRVNL